MTIRPAFFRLPASNDGCIHARTSSLCIGWAISMLAVPAAAADRTLSVTIYADDLALVQDRRDIDVKGGRQRIEFQDVSAQIRPETVSLTAADISIVEQNFDFDLLTPAKLMEKAVGQEDHHRARQSGHRRGDARAGAGARHQRRRGAEDRAAHRGAARRWPAGARDLRQGAGQPARASDPVGDRSSARMREPGRPP